MLNSCLPRSRFTLISKKANSNQSNSKSGSRISPHTPPARRPEKVRSKFPPARLAQYRRPLPWWARTLQYTYNGVKESTAQIPFVGKIIRAFLPKEMPVSRRRELAAAGRFWDYLLVEARRIPVLLVLDNFQFLPDSVAMEIDSVFASADEGLRLVTVERLRAGATESEAWDLRCFPAHRLALTLVPLSFAETSNLVRNILGKNFPNLSEISEAIFRKSGGNPKQIWLQLRSLHFNYAARSAKTEGVSQALELRSNAVPARRAASSSETILGDYEETI